MTDKPEEKTKSEDKVQPESKQEIPHRHRPRYKAPEHDTEEELFNDVPV